MHHSFYAPYMTKVVVVNLFGATEEKSVDHATWENHLRPSIEVNACYCTTLNLEWSPTSYVLVCNTWNRNIESKILDHKFEIFCQAVPSKPCRLLKVINCIDIENRFSCI